MPASSRYVSGFGTETYLLIRQSKSHHPGGRETFAQKISFSTISVISDIDLSVPSTGVQPLPWRELHRRRALDKAQKHPQKPERAAKIAQALAMADKQPLHMAEIEVLREFIAAL